MDECGVARGRFLGPVFRVLDGLLVYPTLTVVLFLFGSLENRADFRPHL